jgi:predicted nuclease with TOPRIM domain
MSNYEALYEKQLKENKLLRQKLKTTQFISGMTVKKLAGSCKEAIDGDIKEAEKQIKHLTEKNKELQNNLNILVTASETTFNQYKEAIEDLKTIAQDKHDSLQTYKKENKKLKEENEKLKWDCEAGWNRVEHAHKMLKLKEENKKAEDNLDEEMLKNEKLEVEIKKLKSTINVKKALINHWKNKYDKSLKA